MAANKLEVYIGKFKTSMTYSNDNEKEVLEEITSEANKEFNKLLISCGRLDERMLMFFMILNLQKEISTTLGKKENFLEIFKSVSMFVIQTTNIESQLILGIIYKKNELRKILKAGNKVNNEESFVEKFNNFVEETIGKIKNITEINI